MSIFCIGSLHMRQMGVLPHPKIVKQRLNVKYNSCNIPIPPEQVCGIHVQNEILTKIGDYCREPML